MAKLRIFVSSTCYDLDILRSELRPFIVEMGYEPVMSDYSDVLYDPRSHTHDSCLKEIPNCDMVLLIIGSRFGGLAIPAAVANIDLAQLEKLSTKTTLLETKDMFSITQLEALKAIEQSIPVYAFVDEKVLNDHRVYERNKDKQTVIDQIEFPSIQKRDTARYIFEFINFLSHRITNNSITGFSRLEEIKSHLTSQWSQLFQRLLLEARTKTREERRYRDFSERIEDLKAIILTSLGTPGLRETAKGAIHFRRLISFISGLRISDHRKLLLSDTSWDELLAQAQIKSILSGDSEKGLWRYEVALVLEDETFYRCRMPRSLFDDLPREWDNFKRLEIHAREAIADALLEDSGARVFGVLRYYNKNFREFSSEPPAPLAESIADSESSSESGRTVAD